MTSYVLIALMLLVGFNAGDNPTYDERLIQADRESRAVFRYQTSWERYGKVDYLATLEEMECGEKWCGDCADYLHNLLIPALERNGITGYEAKVYRFEDGWHAGALVGKYFLSNWGIMYMEGK
jgi:hypothetical protein